MKRYGKILLFRFFKHKRGYTLVELLVVTSIIIVLSSVGLASYLNFNRSQILNQAARKIVQDLRLAQSMAENNQKPPGACQTLNGYNFSITGDFTYEITADCTPAYEDGPVKSDSVPANLSISGFSNIKFRVLKQGLAESPPGTLSLTVSSNDFAKTVTIEVEKGGTIKVKDD